MSSTHLLFSLFPSLSFSSLENKTARDKLRAFRRMRLQCELFDVAAKAADSFTCTFDLVQQGSGVRYKQAKTVIFNSAGVVTAVRRSQAAAEHLAKQEADEAKKRQQRERKNSMTSASTRSDSSLISTTMVNLRLQKRNSFARALLDAFVASFRNPPNACFVVGLVLKGLVLLPFFILTAVSLPILFVIFPLALLLFTITEMRAPRWLWLVMVFIASIAGIANIAADLAYVVGLIVFYFSNATFSSDEGAFLLARIIVTLAGPLAMVFFVYSAMASEKGDKEEKFSVKSGVGLLLLGIFVKLALVVGRVYYAFFALSETRKAHNKQLTKESMNTLEVRRKVALFGFIHFFN